MTDSPIQYRLIKKEKPQVPRLGEGIAPPGTFPTNVYACRDSGEPLDNHEELKRKWVQEYLGQHLHLWLRPGDDLVAKSRRTASILELGPANF